MMSVCSLFSLGTVFITSFSFLLKSVSPEILGIKIFYLGMRGELIRVLLSFFFTVGMFFFLYKFFPNRSIQTKIAFYSSLAASIMWEFAKQGFRFYLFNAADLSKTYGSFGLLFAMVFWVYYSCIVFILGAEIIWVWNESRATLKKSRGEQ